MVAAGIATIGEKAAVAFTNKVLVKSIGKIRTSNIDISS